MFDYRWKSKSRTYKVGGKNSAMSKNFPHTKFGLVRMNRVKRGGEGGGRIPPLI